MKLHPAPTVEALVPSILPLHIAVRTWKEPYLIEIPGYVLRNYQRRGPKSTPGNQAHIHSAL